MPIIRNTFAGRPAQRRSRSMPIASGSRTSAGVNVTPERALQISAVYSCVRLLAETVAGLPVSLLRRTEDGRERVRDNPLLRLVADEPNPTMDSAEYFRLIMGFMLLRGDGFGYVERTRSGDPVGLWPLPKTCVDTRRAPSGKLVYRAEPDDDNWAPIRESGGLVQPENMLHYRAFGLGAEGLSPIGLARQSAGISWAAQSYVGGFFERDASPGGAVTVPGELSDKAYDRLTETWSDLHEGFDKSHRLAILEGGAKWEKVSLSPADAAFLEIYKLTRGDIAGIYGVPPHMIGDTDKATSWGSGIEQQSLGFVIYSAMSWVTRLERVTGRLRGADRNLYVKFNPAGLVRGDITARYTAYGQARQWGWFSANDVRELEDLDPIADGDTYLHPVNMVPAGQAAPTNQRSLPRGARQLRVVDAPAEAYPAWVTRHREALADYWQQQGDEILAAYGPSTRAAAEAVAEAADATWDERLAEVLLRLALGLAGEAGAAAAQALGGVFTPTWARAYLESNADAAAASINRTTRDQLAAILGDTGLDDPREALVELFTQMLTGRAAAVAEARTNEVGNFARHEGARQAGATSKTWHAHSNARPTHAAADGQTVPLDDQFIIGTHRGRWPRDHKLGVDEIAGCNCSMTFTKEE